MFVSILEGTYDNSILKTIEDDGEAFMDMTSKIMNITKKGIKREKTEATSEMWVY